MIITLLLLLLIAPAGAELRLSTPAVEPGKTLVVDYLTTESYAAVSGELFGQSFPFFPNAQGWRGRVGIPLDKNPGEYQLRVTLGSAGAVARLVKVAGKEYPKVAFKLKPAKSKLLKRDLVAEEWGEIEQVLIKLQTEQLWEGKFSWPATPEVSMRFGAKELINGQLRGRHRGIDLAVPTGTKIFAPNAGVVSLAKFFKAFGGTVVVDHGQGVQSLYFHLSKINVKPGDKVARGDLLAYSGNTGISSGPHLHWGLSLNNLRVDPAQWVREAL